MNLVPDYLSQACELNSKLKTQNSKRFNAGGVNDCSDA
jgi:hypothetical protein